MKTLFAVTVIAVAHFFLSLFCLTTAAAVVMARLDDHGATSPETSSMLERAASLGTTILLFPLSLFLNRIPSSLEQLWFAGNSLLWGVVLVGICKYLQGVLTRR